jgi:hypothetical protein
MERKQTQGYHEISMFMLEQLKQNQLQQNFERKDIFIPQLTGNLPTGQTSMTL